MQHNAVVDGPPNTGVRYGWFRFQPVYVDDSGRGRVFPGFSNRIRINVRGTLIPLQWDRPVDLTRATRATLTGPEQPCSCTAAHATHAFASALRMCQLRKQGAQRRN
jgi:hypothetical protein